MAVYFQDETRLVTDHAMFWVGPASKTGRRNGYQWAIHDTEGTELHYNNRDTAIKALSLLAKEERNH